MNKLSKTSPFFIFDVESLGLYGDPFAVAGGVYFENGSREDEFCYAIPRVKGNCWECDWAWLEKNVSHLPPTHTHPEAMFAAFYERYAWANRHYPDLPVAVECGWPVEARFLLKVFPPIPLREFQAPYPLHEIATVMALAGIDPMATHERLFDERPVHHPLADTRQSARLLFESLRILNTK